MNNIIDENQIPAIDRWLILSMGAKNLAYFLCGVWMLLAFMFPRSQLFVSAVNLFVFIFLLYVDRRLLKFRRNDINPLPLRQKAAPIDDVITFFGFFPFGLFLLAVKFY